MNTLINKVQEYQQSNNDLIFEDISTILTPLINKKLSKIDKKYIQDLKQELWLSMYEAVLKFKLEKKEISINMKLSKIKVIYDEVIKNKYFTSFKLNYNEFNSLDITKKDELVKLINEFYKFCNQNQFLKYIKTVINNKYIDFLRKHKNDKEIISLNIINDYDDEELLYKIVDENPTSINYEIDYSLLTNEEINFLKLFHKDNRKLKEIEVAKILGISQQAVSKRLKKIKNKLI